MCRCALSRRSVDYPGDEVTLEFQGAEYLVDSTEAEAEHGGPQGLAPAGYWDASTRVDTALANTYDALSLGAFSWVSIASDAATDAVTGWVDPGQQWYGVQGENYLDILRDVADRIDGWVRVDELGALRMSRRQWGTPATYHRLRVGADGTIISGNDELSREGWANFAYVTYEWTTKTTTGGVTTETQRSASAFATLTDKYDPINVGRVTVADVRQHISSDAQAQQAANALLRRFSTKGDALTVAGVAAYWLRPGYGVAVQLPSGPEKILRVSAISFDLDTGRMDIRTRSPIPGPVKGL